MKISKAIPAFAGVLCAAIPTIIRADAFSNVPEASGYSLAYQYDFANNANNIDNSATVGNTFTRVAYYMELGGSTNGGDSNGYVFVSFDRLSGMTSASKVGAPYAGSGIVYQQSIANMNVVSNVPGIVTGTGIQSGNIEFWASDYDRQNNANVANASPDTFDFGDTGGSSSSGYGSMQLHNHDLDGTGPGTAGQTLFAYNNFGGGNTTSDLGIGNNTTRTFAYPNTGGLGDVHPDWTFRNNAGDYSTKYIQVLVSVPEPGCLSVLVAGAAGLLARRRHVDSKLVAS